MGKLTAISANLAPDWVQAGNLGQLRDGIEYAGVQLDWLLYDIDEAFRDASVSPDVAPAAGFVTCQNVVSTIDAGLEGLV